MSVDPRKYHPALAAKEKRAAEEHVLARAQLDNIPSNSTDPVEGTQKEAGAFQGGGGIRPSVVSAPGASPAERAPEVAPPAAIMDGLPDAVFVPADDTPPISPEQIVTQAPATTRQDVDYALQAQLKAAQEERDVLKAQLADAERARNEAALKQDITFSDEELVVSDPNDAAAIARKAASVAAARAAAEVAASEKRIRENMEKEFAARQAALAAENAKRAEDLHIRNVNAVLRAAVPEIETILETPTYKAYVSRPVEGGGTRLAQMQRAYAMGDTDYIVQVLNKVKSALPDIGMVQRVAPNSVGQQYMPETTKSEEEPQVLQNNIIAAVTGGRDAIAAFRGYYANRDKPAGQSATQA